MLHRCRDFFPRRETAWLASAVRSPGPALKLGMACARVNATNGGWFCAISICSARGGLFFTAALDRGRYPHRLAIFRHSAPRNVDARLAQTIHDGIVGQDIARVFGINQLLDAMTHRLGGVCLAAIRGVDR